MLGEIKRDTRGELMEFVNQPGQVFVVRSRPGAIRGNHYHSRKVEKFLVVSGHGIIWTRSRYSEKVISNVVYDDQFKIVEIPPMVVHSIENRGKSDLIVVAWASEVFDKNDTDTYEESV